MKQLALFGATGTIGDNALDIVRTHPQHFRITTLTAHDNAEKLIRLAKEFLPKRVVIGNSAHYDLVRDALPSTIDVLSGEAGLIEAASAPCDMFLSAIIGFSALRPTMAAIAAGHNIALANKECLVAAGSLFIAACHAHHTTLLPVDSEHNALFQLWHCLQNNAAKNITLTASGGPFRHLTYEQMQHVTPAQAVAHPNWNMGAKISVDSASMMNKGLELIEAMHLFALKPEQCHAIIHPESIMHCLIEMADGSHFAQLALPDMRTPIAHALHYPQRLELNIPSLNLADIGRLHFETADAARFKCLQLAYDVMHAPASAAITLNAANEIAVEAFLHSRIAFTDIAHVIDATLQAYAAHELTHLDEVYEIDHISRENAKKTILAHRH
jgi:1-deoxy-D-xylulose-5-phosphate reductoisomerase